jgi:hypothetical protein
MRMSKRVSVGYHCNAAPLTREESGLGRECRRRFYTIEEAENFIGTHLMSICPEKVLDGEFYIDAPVTLLELYQNRG